MGAVYFECSSVCFLLAKNEHFQVYWSVDFDIHLKINNYRGVTLLSVPGKVFAWIIIDRVCHHLLEHQHPEQSGFTPKRSTIDRILALWSSLNADESFGKGCLQTMLILVKRLIQ